MRTLLPLLLLWGCTDSGGKDTGDTFTGGGSEHCGDVSPGEVWRTADNPHLITCSVDIEDADLTIEAGVEILVSDDASFRVGYYGGTADLVVQGTAEQPVSLSAVNPEPGAWTGLHIYEAAQTVSIAHLKLSDAGGSSYGDGGAISVDDTEASLQNVSVSDSLSCALVLRDEGRLSPDSTALTLTGSDWPACVDVYGVASLPAADSDYTGNRIDHVVVSTGTAETSATWEALGVPYFVDGTVYWEGVTGAPAVWTVGPGAVVTVADDGALRVGYYGGPAGILVQGTEEAPVTFRSAESQVPGAWQGLQVFDAADDDQVKLAHLTVQHTQSGLWANDAVASVEGLMLEEAEEDAFRFSGTARFADGSGPLTITGSGWAGSIEANEADSVPEGNTISGNTVDAIMTSGQIDTSATWGDAGAPYWVVGNVFAEGTSAAPTIVTFLSGTTLAFDDGAGLYIGYYGGEAGLIVDGTGDAPVTFTAAGAAVPGAWSGIHFYDAAVDASCTIVGADIGYAGGSNSDGNVTLDDASPTISDSRIHNSAGWGLYTEGASKPTLDNVSFADNIGGDQN